MYWGYMIQLSMNMWADVDQSQLPATSYGYRDHLWFEDEAWEAILAELVEARANLLLIDLGDGIAWESHPEIAVKGAWTRERLRTELARLRERGIQPIPKLNFSACHDAWLGQYSRMLSTEPYYRVCADLIAEAVELFDNPPLFHLGMDEENVANQARFEYVVLRQHDLWWRDLAFLVDEVEKHGSRAWVWSDYGWAHPETYYDRMPRTVLQSNWHYYDFEADVDERPRLLRSTDSHVAYLDLEDHGFDQIPASSNFRRDENAVRTVQFVRDVIAPERLFGYLQTPWRETTMDRLQVHREAIRQLGDARRVHEERAAEAVLSSPSTDR